MFFILQACGLFSVPVDNVVIARILGPEAVAQYAVPMRLFLLLLSTATMFVMPLWPAYGEALARGDVKWVKSTLYRSTGYTLLGFGSVAVGLAGFGKIIMRVWVGNQIRPTYPLLFGMATWTVLAVFGIATSTFFAGINKLRFQVVVSVVAAVGMLVSKIGLTRVFGLPGAAWAPVVTAVPTTVLFAAYINRLLAHPESLATRQAVADDHTSSEL
jgi:O-antigen/teichoic acid export membrane protein